MNTLTSFPRFIQEALQGVAPSASRRQFLASSGALVLSVGASALPGARVLAQAAAGPYP
ncbi:MAG: hypothetical protein RLZZ169_1203, partial [Pseudomonadota bacterium]